LNQDPFKKEQQLSRKLDEYHIEVPDFPIKPSRWGRFVHFLASPAKDPIEPLISAADGFMLIKAVPIIGTAVIAIIQALILL